MSAPEGDDEDEPKHGLFFEQFNIHTSDKVLELLSTPEARKLVLTNIEYIFRGKALFESFIAKENREHFYVNVYLAQLCAEAAYIDLTHKNDLHDMNSGPSASKKGAALASWINRHHPIQITTDLKDHSLPFANAFVALIAGLTLKWTEEDAAIGDIREIINEDRRIGQLIYDLMWRSPDYRQITTIFSLF